MINKENRDSAFISYEQKQLYKKLFIRAGILSGFFCVLFGLLVVFSIMASKSWRTSVRSYLTSYLNADEKQSYELGDPIHISSSISYNCVLFPISSSSTPSEYEYVAVVRIASIYGPLAAVYLCRENHVVFNGFLGMEESVSRKISHSVEYSQVKFWGNKVMNILDSNLDKIKEEDEK